MAAGHSRTQRARGPGHLGDLPVRRGHFFFPLASTYSLMLGALAWFAGKHRRARAHHAPHPTCERSTVMFTPPPAFTIDERYDRDYASDGHSRYGSYLAQHAHLFLDGGVPTADVVWFAFSAWEVATPPIMTPGYLRTDPRIIATDPHGDDDGRPAMTIHLVAPLPQRIPYVLGPRIHTWEPLGAGQVHTWQQPWDNDRISAFTTLTLRIPLAVGSLPTPRYRVDIPDLATARQAVTVLCTAVNPVISAALAVLDDPRVIP